MMAAAPQPLPSPNGYPDLTPDGIRLAMDGALMAGHRLSETDAKHFICHYAAQSWRGTNGQLLSWRYKVVEWAINCEQGVGPNGNRAKPERDRTKPGF